MNPSELIRKKRNGAKLSREELKFLIDGYLTTVPLAPRIATLGRIVHITTDQLTLMGLYYNPLPGAIASSVAGVSTDWPLNTITWNVHEWELSS